MVVFVLLLGWIVLLFCLVYFGDLVGVDCAVWPGVCAFVLCLWLCDCFLVVWFCDGCLIVWWVSLLV